MVNRISWVGDYKLPQGITYHESYLKALNGAGALPGWAHGGMNGTRGYSKGDGQLVDNLLPDLPREQLAQLPAVLVPDSNYHKDVRMAFQRLADALRPHFLSVTIQPIPKRGDKHRDASDLHPQVLAELILQAEAKPSTDYNEAIAQLQAHQPRTVAQLLNPPPMPKHVIEGFLPAQTVGTITGEGNAGKTTLVLHLACCIASGTPFLGHTINAPGTGVHLMGEEDQLTADNMLSRVASAFPKSALPSIAERVHVISLRGLTADLAVHKTNTKVEVSDWVDPFIDHLNRYEDLRLVTLDTLSTFEGVPTDANNHAAKVVIRAMERISGKHKCNVLAPAHTSQAAAQQKDETMYATRGATSLIYNAKANYMMRVVHDSNRPGSDTELTALGYTTANPPPVGAQILRLTPTKVNTLTPLEHRPIYLLREGYGYQRLHREANNISGPSHHLEHHEETRFIAVVREIDALHEKQRKASSRKLADGGKLGMSRDAVSRAITRYEALGLVQTTGKGPGLDIRITDEGLSKYQALSAPRQKKHQQQSDPLT
jgi:hypothetical protein